jgi:hypothetical protein
MAHVTESRYKKYAWHIHLYQVDKLVVIIICSIKSGHSINLKILPVLARNEEYMDCIVKGAARINIYPDSLKIYMEYTSSSSWDLVTSILLTK